MKNVTMSFKAPIEFKDSIDFLAQYGNINATKIILEGMSEYISLKKREIESEQYALKRSQEILDDYKRSGVYYTINDL